MTNWFLLLVVGCLACSASSTTPDPDDTYRATAQRNDSTWYGAARASKSVSLASGATCTTNRVDISFVTDLPYSGMAPQQKITGCLDTCVPTQQLVFYRVPLTVGKYELADLTPCAPTQGAILYTQLLGGDAIVDTFVAQPSRTGWLQITTYNAQQNTIEGTFAVELADKWAKTVRFTNGTFKATLK